MWCRKEGADRNVCGSFKSESVLEQRLFARSSLYAGYVASAALIAQPQWRHAAPTAARICGLLHDERNNAGQMIVYELPNVRGSLGS